MTHRSSRLRYALVQQIMSALLMVAFAVVSARWLGPAGKGEFSVVSTVALVAASLLGLGLPQALTTWVSNDRFSVREGLFAGYVWAIACAGLILVVSMLLRVETLAIRVLWFTTGALLLDQTMTGIAVGSGDLKAALSYRVLGSGSQVAFMAAGLVLGLTPSIPVVTIVYFGIAGLAVVVVSSGMVRRTGGRSAERFEFANLVKQMPALAGFGLRAIPAQLLAMANMRVDIIILSGSVTSAVVGVYALAVSATLLVGMVPAAVGQALTRGFGLGDDPIARLRLGLQSSLIFGVISGAILALVSPFAVPLVFGRGFAPATEYIWIMTPFTAVFSLVQVSYPFFYSQLHKPLIHSVIVGITVAIDVLLVAVLAPLYGGMGAAVASAVAYGVGALVNVVVLAKVTGLGVRGLMVPHADDLRWIWRHSLSIMRLGGEG